MRVEIVTVLGARPQFISRGPHGEMTGPMLERIERVLLDETESIETIAAGANVLTGADAARIVAATERALEGGVPGDGVRPYGDGHAAERIVAHLAAARR